MATGFNEIFDLIRSLEDTEAAERTAANTTHTFHKQRIFADGKAADGSTIGSYSTKETYVSNSKSPRRLSGKGKTGKSVFKSGKAHTSTYFGGGYKQFRATVGRQTQRVDLRLTGQMEQDYQLDVIGDGRIVAGFFNSTNHDKAIGNEEHFGKEIFVLSESEADLFAETFEAEMVRRAGL